MVSCIYFPLKDTAFVVDSSRRRWHHPTEPSAMAAEWVRNRSFFQSWLCTSSPGSIAVFTKNLSSTNCNLFNTVVVVVVVHGCGLLVVAVCCLLVVACWLLLYVAYSSSDVERVRWSSVQPVHPFKRGWPGPNGPTVEKLTVGTEIDSWYRPSTMLRTSEIKYSTVFGYILYYNV